MATNYNNEGTFLGYFDSYASLTSQYSGERGDLAIAGGRLYYHNGKVWSMLLTPVDNSHLEEVEQLKTAVSNLQDTLTSIQNSGGGTVEMRWSLQQDQLPNESATKWSTSPLTPTEVDPICYISMRSRNVAGTWSAWTTPTPWSYYQYPAEKADKVQTIYILTANISATTISNLSYTLKKIDSTCDEFQADDYLPSGWSLSVPTMSLNMPYICMSQRTYTNGKWGAYTTPVPVYTYNANSKVQLVLDNMTVPYACNADGSRYVSEGQTAGLITTGIHLYKGADEIDIVKSCKVTLPDNANLTLNGSDLIYEPQTSDADVMSFTINVEYEGETYSTVWSVIKVRPGADGEDAETFDLQFSPNALIKTDEYTFNNDSDTQHISIKILHTKGSESELIDIADYYNTHISNDDGFLIEATTDVGSVPRGKYGCIVAMLGARYGSSCYTTPIGNKVDGAVTYYQLCLFNPVYITVTLFKDGVYQDSQTIPVLLANEWVNSIKQTIEENVSESISNSTEFKEMRETYAWVLDYDKEGMLQSQNLVEYFKSVFDLDSTKISLEVSSQIKDELKSAGIEIQSSGVAIYGDKVTIKNNSNVAALFKDNTLSLKSINLINEDDDIVMNFSQDGAIVIYDNPADIATSPYAVINPTNVNYPPIVKYNAKGIVIGLVNWSSYNPSANEDVFPATLYKIYDSEYNDADTDWKKGNLAQAVERFVNGINQFVDIEVQRNNIGQASATDGKTVLSGYYATKVWRMMNGAPYAWVQLYRYEPNSSNDKISDLIATYVARSEDYYEATGEFGFMKGSGTITLKTT
jgi:hypothetical protein